MGEGGKEGEKMKEVQKMCEMFIPRPSSICFFYPASLPASSQES